MWVGSLGQGDPLEEGMATHSSFLAWKIPRTEEPGGLQSVRVSQSWTWLKWLSTQHIVSTLSLYSPSDKPLMSVWWMNKFAHMYPMYIFVCQHLVTVMEAVCTHFSVVWGLPPLPGVQLSGGYKNPQADLPIYFLNCDLWWLEVLKWSEVKVAESCMTLDHTVHGILQARILEWVTFPFSRGSSQPGGRTRVSCSAGGFFIR